MLVLGLVVAVVVVVYVVEVVVVFGLVKIGVVVYIVKVVEIILMGRMRFMGVLWVVRVVTEIIVGVEATARVVGRVWVLALMLRVELVKWFLELVEGAVERGDKDKENRDE